MQHLASSPVPTYKSFHFTYVFVFPQQTEASDCNRERAWGHGWSKNRVRIQMMVWFVIVMIVCVCVCVWLVLHFGIVGVFFLKCLIIAFKCKELHMFLFFLTTWQTAALGLRRCSSHPEVAVKWPFDTRCGMCRQTMWDFFVFLLTQNHLSRYFFFLKVQKKRGCL